MRCVAGSSLVRVLKASCALSGLVFALSVGGAIEGWVAPVMGPLALVGQEPHPREEGAPEWIAVAAQHRSCRFVRLDWYGGGAGLGQAPVALATEHPNAAPLKGQMAWFGIVGPDEAGDLNTGRAQILHKCQGRPWLVRSFGGPRP